MSNTVPEVMSPPARFQLLDDPAAESHEQWYVAIDDDGEVYIMAGACRPERYVAGPFTSFDDADAYLGRSFLDTLDDVLTPRGREVVGYIGLAMTIGSLFFIAYHTVVMLP